MTLPDNERVRDGLIGAAAGAVALLCAVLVAVGNPDGWAAWRVALACVWVIPVGAVVGAIWRA